MSFEGLERKIRKECLLFPTVAIILLLSFSLYLLYLFPAKNIYSVDSLPEGTLRHAIKPAFEEELILRFLVFEIVFLLLIINEKEKKKSLIWEKRSRQIFFGDPYFEIFEMFSKRSVAIIFLISSSIFGALHFFGYGWNKIIPSILAGAAFGIAYLRFGFPGAFFTHFLNNFYILAVAINFEDENELFRTNLEVLTISIALFSLLPILASTQEWLNQRITNMQIDEFKSLSRQS